MSLVEQLSLFKEEAKDSKIQPLRESYFLRTLERLNVHHSGYWHDIFGDSLRTWYSNRIKNEITTLSLFSGAGGLDIGFHDAGFSIHSLVEIDERFCATLEANVKNGNIFNQAKVHCLDVQKYNAADLSKVDFIIGGPPCQTFSAAGRRAAGVAGLKDARGSLFTEYVRLLKDLQPVGFLFENVYGITGAEDGQAWEGIKKAFEEAGYRIHHRILDAADYGVPQHRERVFIVGVKQGLNFLFPRPTHGPDADGGLCHISASEVLQNLDVADKLNQRELGGRYGHLLKDIPPGLNYSFFTEKMGHPTPVFAWRSKFSDFLYKAHPDMPVRTIKAQGGQYTGPFHWESRPFSVQELKRLQTFPDKYEIVGGRGVAIHQIGNSVTPQQGRLLAMAVLDQVFAVEPPSSIDYLSTDEELGFRIRKKQLTKLYSTLAKEALQENQLSTSYKFEERIYSAYLTSDFTLREGMVKKNSHTILVEKLSESYRFCIDNANQDQENVYSIKIKPKNKKSWFFNADFLEIQGLLDEEIFSFGWKILEHELRRNNIRPDLVQLNNYYQYEPNIEIELVLPQFFDCPDIWKALYNVTRSFCTRSLLSIQELASIWKIQEKKVLPVAQKLKKLGYEIRNNNTNIQIPEGYLLIPYAFPTLSKESVQRWKNLSKEQQKKV